MNETASTLCVVDAVLDAVEGFFSLPLEAHGLVVRSDGTEATSCVRCSLTDRGQTVRPILAALVNWGHAHLAAEYTAGAD